MRYLYGDLTEYPVQENTLRLLEDLIEMAVDVLILDRQIASALSCIDADRGFLAKALEEVDRFEQSVQEQVKATVADRSEDDVVSLLAQGVAEKLSHFIDEGKTKVAATIEKRIQQNQEEIERISLHIRNRLKEFFIANSLPVSQNSLHCTLEDQHYQARSEILDVAGVLCSYTLETADLEFFDGPTRFADVVPGKQEMPVGSRRARFKKEPVAELMRLDDALLIQVMDGDQRTEFRLAKHKGNGTEGLLVRIAKSEENEIEVFRIEADGGKYAVLSEVLSCDHLQVLSSFFEQLAPQIKALYRARTGISSISIDGQEVVSGQLITELIERLVRNLAPTIREIDARSPATGELCLKVEHQGGRREEIYVPKKKLIARIRELPDPLADLFAPLGILPGSPTDTSQAPSKEKPRSKSKSEKTES